MTEEAEIAWTRMNEEAARLRSIGVTMQCSHPLCQEWYKVRDEMNKNASARVKK